MSGWRGRLLLLAWFVFTGEHSARSEPLEGKAPPGPQGQERARIDLYGDLLPAGAFARMGTVRLRHDHSYGPLTTALAPDGKMLATGDPNTIRLWDTATGKLRLQLSEKDHYGQLMFSPDGKWLVATGNQTLLLWDPTTGRLLRRLPSEGRWPYHLRLLTFSPDSKFLVVGSEDAVCFWDPATGQQTLRLQGHERGASLAAFAPDGRTLVSVGKDPNYKDTICHWDVTTGMLRKQVQLVLPPWRTWRLSPDGRTLAVTPSSQEAVRLWDTATGQERCALQGDRAHGGYGLTFTPDGRTLATDWIDSDSGEGTISLWDTGTGKLLRRFLIPVRAMEAHRFAPDGRTLVMTAGPVVYLWDTATGQRLMHRPAHESLVQSLSFTPDGRMLVSGGDETIRLWDTATGRQVRELTGHRGGVSTVAVLPDGQAILSGGEDGLLRLQDLHTGEERRRFLPEPRPGKLPGSGHRVRSFGLALDGKTALSFSSIYDEVAPRSFREVYLLHAWDLTTGRLFHRQRHPSDLRSPSFYADAKIVAEYHHTPPVPEKIVAGKPVPRPDDPGKTEVVVREVATGRRLLALPQPDWSLRLAAFAPDGQTLVTVTYQRSPEDQQARSVTCTLRLWELATGQERLAIPSAEKGERFYYGQLAFAPDSRILATTRGDRTLQLWDVATGKELLRRSGYESPVSSLAFTCDGKVLATGHNDTTILLWDVASAAEWMDPLARPADAQALEAWWADLASSDARKAHAAIWALVAAPQQAVPLLRDRLRPVPAVPADKLKQLLADLDSNQFARREAASRQLADLEAMAEPAIHEALKANPSEEQRQRIETLLAAPRLVRSPQKLRGLRAVQVLEQVGVAAARQVLVELANGAPEARLTQEAKAALERLAKQTAAKS